MNTDIEDTIKNCPTCLNFQANQIKDKTMPHEISQMLLKSFAVDIFTINNEQHPCIVDYHSKSQ